MDSGPASRARCAAMNALVLRRPWLLVLAAVLCLPLFSLPEAARASDAPPPEPTFKITGGGNAHGVGMSQRGARGRALAGQTHEQILRFYYSDHPITTVNTSAMDIRVLLATETVPTASKPVRITARQAGWTSTLFEAYQQPFPVNSYLDVVSNGAGGWLANAWDSAGTLLDSASLVSDVVMLPAQAATQFEMNYRDNIPRHNLNRGRMRIRVMPSGALQTINILNIETYLRGVVACEMSSGYPVEALRAQAVASRGYAMTKIKSTGHFDIHSYRINQVYGGAGCETTRTNNAVADTTGKIVTTSKGGPAETIFHDTAGGATESSEYAWPSDTGVPGAKKSFQRGRIDVDPNGVPYEAGAPSLYWEAGEVTLSQLSDIMAKSSKTNVGQLYSFEFKRGVSGRVYQATLIGSAGTKSVSGAIFKNVFDRNTSGPTLRSTLFYFEPLTAPQLVSQTPPPGATNVHRRAAVELTFSEPVMGVSGTTLRIFDAASGTRISGKVSYDAVGLKARFVADSLLPAGKLLRVDVRTGVAALSGGASLEPASWTFRVTSDATRPTVTTAKTGAGSTTRVYRDSVFKVKFSEPVVNVTTTTVRLRNVSNGTWVPAKVTYDPATRTATLRPNKPLAKGKTYRLVVRTGVQDLAGNSAVKFTWRFRVR
jgi:stage II sporulation protein D